MYLTVPILAVQQGYFSVMNMSVFGDHVWCFSGRDRARTCIIVHYALSHSQPAGEKGGLVVLLEGTEGERWKKREQEHELNTTLGLWA